MANGMETIRAFFIDTYRIVLGKRVLGAGPARTSEEIDARATVKRFARGNVAMQDDRFFSEQDYIRECDEVAQSMTRN